MTVFWAYNSFVHKNVLRIAIKGVFLNDTTVLISSIDALDQERHLETVSATASQTPNTIGTHKLNTPVERLKFEFYQSGEKTEHPSNIVALHSVQVYRPYNRDLFFGANVLFDHFTASTSSSKQRAPAGLVGTPNNQSGTNTLVSKAPLTQEGSTQAGFLALLFFISLWLVFKNGNWTSLPAFKDMSLGRDISSSHEFGSINGLRGIAALLVLLSHTAPGFFALGVGLSLLFVISGFLLSKPFILDRSRIYSVSNIETYLTKRIKRILPMYYFYIFILYVVSLKLDVALRHFLFVQAEGHLWPMTQIFAFYMLLPFILLATSALHRLHTIVPMFVLVAIAYFWRHNMHDWRPFFNGDYYHEFFAYAFLLGVAASYLQYGWLANSERFKNFCNTWRWPLALVGMTITVLTVAWSAPISPPAAIVPYISQFWTKCILCVLMILFALNIKGTWFNSFISNWFFRSIGVIGFSFYILHGLGMQIVQQVQVQFLGFGQISDRSWDLFFGSLVVTYVLSVITYSFVERPFFGFQKKHS